MGLKQIESELKELSKILKGAKKLKAKYPPISFLVDGLPKTLKIKNIYSMGRDYKNFYVFHLKNYKKIPKTRWFLAISLASQSSDLLVSLAKEYMKKSKALRLIQYSIYPNTLRINLLLIIELDANQSYSNAVEVFTDLRKDFRKKLDKINNLIENE